MNEISVGLERGALEILSEVIKLLNYCFKEGNSTLLEFNDELVHFLDEGGQAGISCQYFLHFFELKPLHLSIFDYEKGK